MTYPNGATEHWEYDSEGNCLSTTNPLGATQTMTYDLANRLIELREPDGEEQPTTNTMTAVTSLKRKNCMDPYGDTPIIPAD